ncbi:hypothetical protein [Aquiflexum sp.]|uniref:hypothetical protein n=1 Tax=Aquiflexum sp. TaxID=1872584 RepID=UPI0035943319
MKKSIKIAVISFLMLFGSAKANDEGTEKTLSQVKSKYENVKVYQQASTSTEIVAILEKDETIGYFRDTILNGGGWSIVYVNDRPGYVLSSEIYVEPQLVIKNKRKKNKQAKGDVLGKAGR